MEKRVFALGFFDGVHVGHQALLQQCCCLAKQLDCVPGAVTFDAHPMQYVTGQAPLLINTAADRLALLRRFGMEQVHTVRFDEKTKELNYRDFFRLLTSQLGAVGLVCGDDYRFGKGGEGTADTLRALCREAGIPCEVVPQQTVDGIRVSSTHIRTLLEKGDLEQAVRFLGHPHVLSGTVVSGRQLGRTIGIPTANLHIPEGVAVPRFGVYACKAFAGQGQYLAVTNVGTRPTVGGHRITVEPWLLDFDADLYGQTLTLEFYAFLRPEQKFDALPQLQQQIQADAQQTRQLFAQIGF